MVRLWFMIGGNSVKSYIDAVETYKNFTIISKVKNNFFGKPINVYTVIYNDTNIYKSKNIDKCYKFCDKFIKFVHETMMY